MVQLKNIPLKSIRPCSVQPPGRTHNCRPVVTGDEEIHTPCHVVDCVNYFEMADGHRRWDAQARRGGTHLSCIIHPPGTDPVLLWAQLNKANRPITTKWWFYAWAACKEGKERDEFMKNIPQATRRHIVEMVLFFGKERALEIALTGKKSPTVAAVASRVYQLLAANTEGRMKLTRRDVAEWTLQHGSAIHLLLSGPPLNKNHIRRLASRVASGKPYPRGEW